MVNKENSKKPEKTSPSKPKETTRKKGAVIGDNAQERKDTTSSTGPGRTKNNKKD